MPGAMTIRELLTRYSFKTDTKPIKTLDNAVAGLKKRVAAVDQRIIGAFKRIAQVTAVAAVGAGIAIVKMGSEAEESEAKFEAVFGDQEKSVRSWSEQVAKSMGRSEFKMREFAASLQDTFVPLGFARDVAAQMSMNLVELSEDVASFQNKASPEVMRDFQSALVGNHETVRKYGIIITQARLDKKIAAMKREMPGFTRLAKEQQQVLARSKLIFEGTSDAQGDAHRTAGSFANQMKRVRAQVEDVAKKVGMKLMPIMAKWLKAASDWIAKNEVLIRLKIEALIEKIGAAFKAMKPVLSWVIRNWDRLVRLLGVLIAARILFGLGRITQQLGGMFSALAAVTKGAKTASTALEAASQKSTGFKASLGGVALAATGVIAAFGAGWTVGKLLDEWLGLSDKISDKWADLEERVGKLKNRVEGIADKHRDLVAQAKKYAELAAKGVKTVELPGGGRMELTRENIQKRLAAAARQMGYAQKLSPEFAANILKNVPAAAPAVAPTAGRTDIKVDSPQVEIKMPPGSTAEQARKLGEESANALMQQLRRAMGDVPR